MASENWYHYMILNFRFKFPGTYLVPSKLVCWTNKRMKDNAKKENSAEQI